MGNDGFHPVYPVMMAGHHFIRENGGLYKMWSQIAGFLVKMQYRPVFDLRSENALLGDDKPDTALHFMYQQCRPRTWNQLIPTW